MMPILKEIEEQALSLQFKTHNVAKWLGLAVRKLEAIKEKCLKEQEDLRDLDRELDADEKLEEQLQAQEKNLQEQGENSHPLGKEIQDIQDSQIQIKCEQESDTNSKKKEKNFSGLNDFPIQKKVKKDKKLEKQIERKPKVLKQQPNLMFCNKCGAKYKKVEKLETHMRLFHGQLDFSYENQLSLQDQLEKAQKHYYIEVVHQSELKEEEINQENDLAIQSIPQ